MRIDGTRNKIPIPTSHVIINLVTYYYYYVLWTSKINIAIIDYIFFYGLFPRISGISNEILLNPLFYSVSKASPLGGNLFPSR